MDITPLITVLLKNDTPTYEFNTYIALHADCGPLIDEWSLNTITRGKLNGAFCSCKLVGLGSKCDGLHRAPNSRYTLGDYSNHPTLVLDSLDAASSYTYYVDTEKQELVVSREGTEDWKFQYSSDIPYLLAIVEAKPSSQLQSSATAAAPHVLSPGTLLALRDSFEGTLTPKGKSALALLKGFIMNTRKSMRDIYSPITSVAQSSGMGKQIFQIYSYLTLSHFLSLKASPN